MSADLIQKLFSSSTPGGTTDSAAAADVPQDGSIESLLLSLTATGLDALNDQARMEISFSSTNTFNQNDARTSIADIMLTLNLLTSGGGAPGIHVPMMGIDIPVFGGERLHLHVFGSAGVQVIAIAYIYYRIRGGARRRTQRRL